MPAYVIFDVDIYDMERYQEFMLGVKPALEEAGASIFLAEENIRYLRVIGNRAGLYCSNSRRLPIGKNSTTARHIRC